MRCVQPMNAPKDAATEPVVGTQLRGLTSTSMKARMNSEAAFFNSGTPAAGGYWEPTPRSNARFSASTPKWLTGRPGEPWSMRTKGMPVCCSRYCAASRISPIVAVERSAMLLARHASATCASLKIFIAP